MFAPTTSLGKTFGLGVGLYFKQLEWLFLACLTMFIFSLPFIIVIHCSKFTDSKDRQDSSVGVKLYGDSQLYSFTFSAIIDSNLDNNTLAYINTYIAYVWKGPMKKGDFLAWISVLDVVASLLVFCGFIYAYFKTRWFLAVVDGATLEVSDFSILVRGLPKDSTAVEVGEYFERRFGVVMDVVLVTNLSVVLQCCAIHKRLEGQLELLRDRQHIYSRDELLAHITKLERQAAAVFARIERDKANPRIGEVRSALVTFDQQVSAHNALQNCPSSWLTRRWHMRPALRFRGTHTFWLKKASAAEDYMYENLSVGAVEAFFRKVFVYAVVGALIVVSAFIITKLASISTTETQKIFWYTGHLNAAVAATGPGLLNKGFGSDTHLVDIPQAELNLTAVARSCGKLLPSCAAYFSRQQSTNFSMAYGSQLMWPKPVEELLKESNVYQTMQDCYTSNTCTLAGLSLAGCLPCWCQGLNLAESRHSTEAAWKQQTLSGCAPWVDNYNLSSCSPTASAPNPLSSSPVLLQQPNSRGSSRRPPQMGAPALVVAMTQRSPQEPRGAYYGIKIGISFVISVVNFLLKFVLSYMVVLERRWTRTHEGLSYSLMCFTSTFLNSVVVLMLVNMSALHTATNKSTLTDSSYYNFFILNGTYDDFSPEWYNNVGLSIQILLIVNLSSPLVMLVSDWSFMKAMRFLVYHTESSTQEDYNQAWANIPFTMEQRAADAMLNISLALLFGSGMPLVYLFAMLQFLVQNLVDRAVLTKVCSKGTRYSSQLAGQVLTVFPYLLIGHVAFGLWMHTYFAADTKLFNLRAHGYLLSELSSTKLFASLDQSSTWQRITQPNGILLFATFLLLLLWLFIRQSLWNAGVWLWTSMQPSDELKELRTEAQAQAKALREKRLAEAKELRRKRQSARAPRISDAEDALADLAPAHPRLSAKPHPPTAPGNTATVAPLPPPPPTTLATPPPPPPPPHSSVCVVDSWGGAAAAEPAKPMEQGNARAKAAPAGVVSNKQSAFAAAAAGVAAEADARHAKAVERAGRGGFWHSLGRPDETQAEVLANLNTSYSEALLGGLFASVPTYQLRLHPTYTHLLDSELYNELWTKAMGLETYTRLAKQDGPGQLFVILDQPQRSDARMSQHIEAFRGNLTQDIIMEDLRVASRNGSLFLTNVSVTGKRSLHAHSGSGATSRQSSSLITSSVAASRQRSAPTRATSATPPTATLEPGMAHAASEPIPNSMQPRVHPTRRPPAPRPSRLSPLDTIASGFTSINKLSRLASEPILLTDDRVSSRVPRPSPNNNNNTNTNTNINNNNNNHNNNNNNNSARASANNTTRPSPSARTTPTASPRAHGVAGGPQRAHDAQLLPGAHADGGVDRGSPAGAAVQQTTYVLGPYGMKPWLSKAAFSPKHTSWVWNTAYANIAAPIGSAVFYDMYFNPSNVTVSASVHIMVDNTALVYCNGVLVGSVSQNSYLKTNYPRFFVKLLPGSNTFVFNATNTASSPSHPTTPNSAGLIYGASPPSSPPIAPAPSPSQAPPAAAVTSYAPSASQTSGSATQASSPSATIPLPPPATSPTTAKFNGLTLSTVNSAIATSFWSAFGGFCPIPGFFFPQPANHPAAKPPPSPPYPPPTAASLPPSSPSPPDTPDTPDAPQSSPLPQPPYPFPVAALLPSNPSPGMLAAPSATPTASVLEQSPSSPSVVLNPQSPSAQSPPSPPAVPSSLSTNPSPFPSRLSVPFAFSPPPQSQPPPAPNPTLPPPVPPTLVNVTPTPVRLPAPNTPVFPIAFTPSPPQPSFPGPSLELSPPSPATPASLSPPSPPISAPDAPPLSTKPTATEPTATEPTATELTATELTATKPTATEPTATEPSPTEPTATEPTATEPTATKPPPTKPTTTELTATELTATEPLT
ncbi:MAG: hypothetical protein WDW36_008945 [Sanguina aurantia]